MSRPGTLIARDAHIRRSARVMQVEGIFEVPPTDRTERVWEVHLDLPETWNVGLIVGPSGSGKSTVASAFWPDQIGRDMPLPDGSVPSLFTWDQDRAILDAFPAGMSIKDITDLLSSVGFSTPPAWLRPFWSLSNGEQFRVSLARTLAEHPDLAVVDEFTSVVDRTVAQITSAAVAKAVRRRDAQFVAVSCHYDIIDWLCPDWIYEPHLDRLERRLPRRRPDITLTIQRVHRSAWPIFRDHHYLSTSLSQAAVCFVAWWGDRPVAFTSWLHLPHGRVKTFKREHRTVTLPDYQGVGIGNALSTTVASAWKGLGMRPISSTGNPAMVHSRNRSDVWRMTNAPSRQSSTGDRNRKSTGLAGTRASGRYVASFEYVGPAMHAVVARDLIGGSGD